MRIRQYTGTNSARSHCAGVLYQVLQDSLEGSAKVAMFVNVSPTVESSNESVCSLNFAARVRGVELGTAAASAGPASAKKLRPGTAR